MNQDNLYKKLRIICLILAIVCMGLSLIKRVKAAELPEELQEQIIDIIDNDLNIDVNQAYLDNCFSCPYCAVYSINNGINDIYFFDFYFTKNIGYLYQRSDGRYYYGTTMYFEYTGSNRGYISCSTNYNGEIGTGYRIIAFNTTYYYGSVTATSSNIVNSTNFNIKGLPSTYSDIYGYNIYQNDTRSYTYNVLLSYGDCYLQNGNNFAVHEDTWSPPPSTNTDGFDVYKYGASGSERLVCDFANCISISNAVGNSSTIQIDLTIDGVNQTFNFDSTSSYYNYSVTSHIANYSFPFSVFGINSETISARLTGVKIVNTTTSPGGSGSKDILWVTPITLVGSDYEDLEPEDIKKEQMPDFDKFDDEGTQTNYNGTINRWLTSGNSSFDYSLYTRWNFEPKYYIIPVIYYGAGQAAIDALKAALNLDFGQVVDDVISIGQGVSIEDQIQEFMQENYYLNDLYDILVFAYQGSSGADTVYYIFTTDSYNNHLSNSFLYDVLQAIFDDGKAIEKTYDFLYDKLTDFEAKSLTKFNEIVRLQEIENGFISSLQSILNQILNALLNLNINIPVADYSSITSRLDQIISNQGSGSINNDWYQNYRSWLYEINENDTYLSPHEYFTEIFGSLKTTYDTFIKNTTFNAYLIKLEEFLDHISGNTSDNLTIYLRDGIGDPGFNINHNNMYTVGGQ